MLHKTRGIVFRIIRYSDTSIIANIYTESFGLRSYLVNGVHGKKAKIKASLFQPLALVEMNVTNREKSTMHRINDVMPVHTWTSIPYDIRKSSVLMFINEMLYKSVREEEANPALFEFISHAVQILDLSSVGQLTRLLTTGSLFRRHTGVQPGRRLLPVTRPFSRALHAARNSLLVFRCAGYQFRELPQPWNSATPTPRIAP
jgi:DNA repair protein RecO (recombination protein O)